MNIKNNNILTALLAVILGVLITLTVSKILPDKKFDGDYNRWRKLNLILQEVQKNYVDTIDMKAMTDAAVSAALAELDPHSVYLPPVELTESETELAGNFIRIFSHSANQVFRLCKLCDFFSASSIYSFELFDNLCEFVSLFSHFL